MKKNTTKNKRPQQKQQKATNSNKKNMKEKIKNKK